MNTISKPLLIIALRRGIALALLLALLLGASPRSTPHAQTQNELKVRADDIVLEVGGGANSEKVLELTTKPTPFDQTKLKLEITNTPANMLGQELLTFDNATLKLKTAPGLKWVASSLVLTVRLTHEAIVSNPLKVTIQSNYTLTMKSSKGQDIVADTEIKLLEGEKETLTLEAKKPDGSPLSTSLSSKTPAVATTSNNEIIAVRAKDEQIATIELRVDGQVQFEFKVRVLEAVAKIEPNKSEFSITEGESADLGLILTGTNNTQFNRLQRDVTSQVVGSYVEVSEEGKGFRLKAKPLPPASPNTASPNKVFPDEETVEITFISNQGLARSAVTSPPVTVTVRPKVGFITFKPLPIGVLLPNGMVGTTATVRDIDGKPVPDKVLEFKLENETEDRNWAVLAPEGNDLKVHWNEPDETTIRKPDGTLKKRPPQVIVVASTRIEGRLIESKLFVPMGQVVRFAPLKVKLNLMDERTVSDLYGTVTSKEYHVLTVRLFNNLSSQGQNARPGSSILAYSASIEVGVGLEKRFNGEHRDFLGRSTNKDNSHFSNVLSRKDAKEIAVKQSEKTKEMVEKRIEKFNQLIQARRDDLEKSANQQYQAEKRALELERLSEVAEVKARATNDPKDLAAAQQRRRDAQQARRNADIAAKEVARLKQIIANTIEAQNLPVSPESVFTDVAVDDQQWRPVTRADLQRIAPDTDADTLPVQDDLALASNEPECVGAIKYRPFMFEMIVNTVDRRDERGARARIFKLLELAGTSASFVTALIPPAAGMGDQLTSSDRATFALEKYSNLLLPSLDKLFPSLREQYRQNIVSQVMKNIEEIPFGSDITRVLFIPKKSIEGLIRGHDVRVSEVCPFFFSVEVAVVEKGGTFQQGSITR